MEQYISNGRVDNIDCLVAKRLRTRRILLGINQEDLGKAGNVSIQQIQKYENASNRISSGKLYNFANFLNVPINYFFEFKGEGDKAFVFECLEKPVKEDSDSNVINEKDVLSLVKSFIGIRSSQARKKIIELVKVMV